MNTKLTKVSIGIPAYNEGANIKKLLTVLLAQSHKYFILKEIIVVCDGSTDDTIVNALTVNDKRVCVLSDSMRLGKSARLTQIFKKASGNVLFVMDADIAIADQKLLDTIVHETDFKKAGLVGVNATPLPPKTQFEKIINSGVVAMKDIAKHWNNGNNYLSFRGCFLGLDRSLAKLLTLETSLVNNDAFLYFSAVERGYSPVFLANSVVRYRSPAHFADHLKQASRYRSIKQELQKYFSTEIKTEPLIVMLGSTVRFFIKDPAGLLTYAGIRILTKLAREKKVESRWDIATSTKGADI